PPTDRPPARPFQHCLHGHRLRIGDVTPARAAAAGNREDHRDIGGVDPLFLRNTRRPREAALALTLPARRAQTLFSLRQETTNRHTAPPHPPPFRHVRPLL